MTDECPAGGAHEWEEDSDDCGPYGRTRHWRACANCGVEAPEVKGTDQ